MTIYIPPNNHQLSNIQDRDKFNNTRVIVGTNQELPLSDGVFFLEYLEAATGTTVAIADGNGTQIVAAISSFASDHSPLRCDYGIAITGEVVIAKGFVVPGVFFS